MRRTLFSCVLVVAGTLLSESAQAAPILVNAGFETGTFAGWTVFTTAQGVTNHSIATFDVDGDSSSSFAARFQVGDGILPIGTQEGGGIYQTFISGNETALFSVDIAAQSPNGNGAGGAFSLLIDGVVLDHFDFGSINALTIERSRLSGSLSLSAGTHELRLLITRAFLPSPTQWIDDVRVSSVPEPASMLLLVTGLAGAGLRRWRQKGA